MPAAVVLLSGGLDSTTALAVARSQGFDCYALTVNYGQLHAVELDAARRVAARAGVVDHRIIEIDLAQLAASALTTPNVAVPKDRSLAEIGARGDVPPTYVPARNTVLLALALAWAKSLGAREAQEDILYKSSLATTWDPEARAKLEAGHRIDVQRINDEAERKVSKIRDHR